MAFAMKKFPLSFWGPSINSKLFLHHITPHSFFCRQKERTYLSIIFRVNAKILLMPHNHTLWWQVDTLLFNIYLILNQFLLTYYFNFFFFLDFSSHFKLPFGFTLFMIYPQMTLLFVTQLCSSKMRLSSLRSFKQYLGQM